MGDLLQKPGIRPGGDFCLMQDFLFTRTDKVLYISATRLPGSQHLLIRDMIADEWLHDARQPTTSIH